MGLEHIRELKEKSHLPKPVKKYIIPKISKKRQEKLLTQKPSISEETELQEWYSKIMQNEEGKCWETGQKINKQDKLGWHGSIAHVLPKEHYGTVKTNPLNYMILSMWGGVHGQYDSSWENASKMKVWDYACKIINILYPLLTQEEKRRLPDVIIQELKPEIYNAKI